MKIFFYAIILGLMHNTYAQNTIGKFTSDNKLEIDGKLAFRDIKIGDTGTYNRNVMVDTTHTLNYQNSSSTGYIFSNIYSGVQTTPYTAYNKTGLREVDLHIPIDIVFPPNTSTLVLIEYNVPTSIPNTSTTSNRTSYASAIVYKTVITPNSNAVEIEPFPLYEASRKVSFPIRFIDDGSYYKSLIINGKWVETIDNKTMDNINIKYALFGSGESIYINTPLTFGSTASANSNNVGQSSITIKTYSKNL